MTPEGKFFYRQIRRLYCHDPYVNLPDAEAFSTHGSNKLSFTDSDKRTAEESVENFNLNSRGKDSVGILAVSEAEAVSSGAEIQYGVDADWHVQLDFSSMTRPEKQQATRYLYHCAIDRGWIYRVPKSELR